MRIIYTLFITTLLAGCNVQSQAVLPDNSLAVPAVAESEVVGTKNDDAADDPAIWRNPDDPEQSLVLGTDKKAGIYIYNLTGKKRSFYKAGRVNNIDLRTIRAPGNASGKDVILVGASDRTEDDNPRLALFSLNGETGQLTSLSNTALGSGLGEAYGFCFGQLGEALHAFIITKQGRVLDLAIDMSAAIPAVKLDRQMKVATQAEGCVVDDRTGMLYVGEENTGIWSFDLNVPAPDATEFAMLKKGELTADVEGLALAPEGETGGYLVASSQGDNSYAVYGLADKSFSGRFHVTDGDIDTTSDTDGIELMIGDFGAGFPGGIFVAQDGDNGKGTQNFKYLSWDAIKTVLKL